MKRLLVAAGLITWVAACAPDMVGPEPDLEAPVAAEPTSPPQAGSHFYFLPPLAEQVHSDGEVDPIRHPVVEILEDGQVVDVLDAELSSNGKFYMAVWHSSETRLDPALGHALRVRAMGYDLGSVELMVGASPGDLRARTDRSRMHRIVWGQTVPIKFVIEVGAIPAFGPDFQPTAPARGANLLAPTEGLWAVPVAGMVCDDVNPVSWLSVLMNPHDASGSEHCEPYAESMQQAYPGLNVVEGEAASVLGDHGYLSQAFIMADHYYPPVGSGLEGHVPNAMVTHLNQPAFDDGDRSDMDDLATLLQWYLEHRDWDSDLSNPLANTVSWNSHNCVFWTESNRSGFEVERIEPVSWDEVRVDVLSPRAAVPLGWGDETDGPGVYSDIQINGLELRLTMTGYEDLWCLGEARYSTTGTMQFGIIDVRTGMPISLQGGRAELEAYPVVTISDFDWHPDNWYQFLENWMTEIFEPLIEDMIEQELEAAGREEIAPLLEAALNDLSRVDVIPLPPPFSGALTVERQLDHLQFTDLSGTLGWAMKVHALNSPPPGIPGSMGWEVSMPVFETSGYDAAMSLQDDLLNQILWAAWAGGSLNLDDLTTLGALPIPGGVSLTPSLPPVLTAGVNPGQVFLGWGDVLVEVTGLELPGAPDPVDATLYVSVQMDGQISAAAGGGGATFVASADPRVSMQITEISDVRQRHALRSLLMPALGEVLPGVLNDLVEAVPVPVLDPTVMMPGYPGGPWMLDAASVGHGAHHTLLTGTFR